MQALGRLRAVGRHGRLNGGRRRGLPSAPSLPLVPSHHGRAPVHAAYTSLAPFSTTRRKRPGYTTVPETAVRPHLMGAAQAYAPKEDSVDDYLAKTSLSPWVPLPDAACRAMLDLVGMQASDKHVDLGSGDGRVNFWAADDAKVTWTLGVDVDEGILQVARDRLAKRHPKPAHIDFAQVDLLADQNHAVWDRIREATVISMYFATPALREFRPLLEEQLRGVSCKIITAGYPMPGWQAWQTTVVLGTTLHLYHWGKDWENQYDDEEDGVLLDDDFVLPETAASATQNHLEGSRFQGSKVIDRTTGGDPLQQQMQRLALEELEEDDDGELSDDEDEEGEEEQAKDKYTPQVEKPKSS